MGALPLLPTPTLPTLSLCTATSNTMLDLLMLHFSHPEAMHQTHCSIIETQVSRINGFCRKVCRQGDKESKQDLMRMVVVMFKVFAAMLWIKHITFYHTFILDNLKNHQSVSGFFKPKSNNTIANMKEWVNFYRIT